MHKNIIPPKINLGQHYNTTLYGFFDSQEYKEGYILGLKVPDFQRPLVWTLKQKIKLIESLWVGIPIGTYTINEFVDSPYDLIIIDGQQRLNAIELYINDNFKVYDKFYSELDEKIRGRFKHCVFPKYITHSNDIEYLKQYYNLMNFSGTAHKYKDRA